MLVAQWAYDVGSTNADSMPIGCQYNELIGRERRNNKLLLYLSTAPQE